MQTDGKKENITLALDSTSSPLYMVLDCGGEVYRARKAGIKQEELLFPALNKLFSKAGVKLKDVTRFFYVKGPGRFTGIRIGITLASVLSEINGVQSSSADLFEILKYQAENSAEYKKWQKANPGGVLCLIIHAFREEYFSLLCTENAAPRWSSWEELEAELINGGRPLFVCGWDRERTSLKEKLPANCVYASARLNKINASSMLELCDKLTGKQTLEEVLKPLYLKPARFELCGK